LIIAGSIVLPLAAAGSGALRGGLAVVGAEAARPLPLAGLELANGTGWREGSRRGGGRGG